MPPCAIPAPSVGLRTEYPPKGLLLTPDAAEVSVVDALPDLRWLVTWFTNSYASSHSSKLTLFFRMCSTSLRAMMEYWPPDELDPVFSKRACSISAALSPGFFTGMLP